MIKTETGNKEELNGRGQDSHCEKCSRKIEENEWREMNVHYGLWCSNCLEKYIENEEYFIKIEKN